MLQLAAAAPLSSTLQSAAQHDCGHPRARAAHRPPPPPPSRRYPVRLASATAAAPEPPPPLRLRPGQPSDRALCQQWILREKLNPLALDPCRFTIAERPVGSPAVVVGIGQLKPCGGSALELSSLIVAPEER